MHLSFENKRATLFVSIILFVLIKLPHLNDPFYWDESWVYGPGILTMYDNGPSLLPNAIPVDLSRGHPLLFHFIAVLWAKIFGNTIFSLHCFALTIAVLLAVALFELMQHLFNLRVATISLLLLLCNFSFITASSLVLNDIMLSLFALLALYCYINDKLCITTILLCLNLFIKESGVIVWLIITLDVAYKLTTNRIGIWRSLFRLLVVATPMFMMILFFVSQRIMMGWYLYPGHTSAININIEQTALLSSKSLTIFFYEYRIFIYWMIPAVLSVIAAIRNRDVRYSYIIIFLATQYAILLIFSYKDAIYYLYTFLTIVSLLWVVSKRMKSFNELQRHFIRLSLLFVITYTYFCCINFFEARYLFPALLFASIILLAITIDYLIGKSNNKLYEPVVASIPILAMINYQLGTEAFVMYDQLEVQQKIVEYFEKNIAQHQKIWTYTYQHEIHLKDPKSGFLEKEKVFSDVSNKLTEQTDLLIVDNIEFGPEYLYLRNDTKYELIYRHTKGVFWGEVYQRKNSNSSR